MTHVVRWANAHGHNMADAGASATHALKTTGEEFLSIATDYLIPIGTFAAGVFTMQATIGGFNTVWGLLNKVSFLTQGGTSNVNRVAALILGPIYGSIGYAFWRLGHRPGWVMKLVGRALGGYFFGGAAAMVLQLISPASISSNGLIELISSDVQSATGG